MKRQNENRPGYRSTKCGWIPNEWRCISIGNLGKIITGSTPPTSKKEFYGDDYFFVSPADINDGKYIYETEKKLSRKGYLISRCLPAGSILFTCIGSTIGKVAIANNCLTSNQQINAVIVKDDIFIEYAYYSLAKIAPRIKFLASVQAVPIVNKKEFTLFKIPLPPLPEQKKIADILSAWDRAIDLTQKLIEARQRLKKGLMQQLLTGRMRFPEFGKPVKKKGELPEGWKNMKIGDCFKERIEANPDLPLLSITSDRGVIRRGEVDRKDTSNEDKRKYKRIAVGDIGYNTMRMWQGRSAVSELEGIVSPAYTVCIPREKYISKYFGYLFKYDAMINKFRRYSQGLVDDTLNLKFPIFSQIRVNVPAVNEQHLISNILMACDNEMKLLGQRQESFQIQKKGLMEVLLTGEVRVKTDKTKGE